MCGILRITTDVDHSFRNSTRDAQELYSGNVRVNFVERVSKELTALQERAGNQDIPKSVEQSEPDGTFSRKILDTKGHTLYELQYRRDPQIKNAVILKELPSCEIS